MTNSTRTEKNCFIIVNGPTKREFIDAFKYAYNNKKPRCASFLTRLKNGTNLVRNVKITTIGYENESGLRFNFEGYLQYLMSRDSKVQGYYNSADHTGYFQIIDDQ